MTDVIFKKAEYQYETLKPALFEMIGALEGGQITKNSHFLIKPNLLLPAKPERGILTHPLVVKAVAEKEKPFCVLTYRIDFCINHQIFE